jgi:AcrR family transcriptional regulator
VPPKPSGPAAALSRARVAEHALALARKDGVEALTIERLARELGITPAALKPLVATRRDLINLVRSSLLETVPGLAVSGQAKKRRRYRSLTEAQILEAALEVVRRQGAESLSMRGLAKTLGVSVMGLYHHVPTKEALLEKLWINLLSQVPKPEPDPARWEEQLTEYSAAGVLLLAPYPALLSYGISRKPTAFDLEFSAWVHVVLRGAGFDERSAALGAVTLHMFLLGTAVLVSRFSGMNPMGKSASVDGPYDPRSHGLRALVEFGTRIILRGLRDELDGARGTLAKPVR